MVNWHLNTEFTVDDMDRITNLVNKGWRPTDLAGELDISEARVVALLERNGLPVHPRRKRKWI